jgi:predicted RNase H-like nuclease (RuvC/YqgF family)
MRVWLSITVLSVILTGYLIYKNNIYQRFIGSKQEIIRKEPKPIGQQQAEYPGQLQSAPEKKIRKPSLEAQIKVLRQDLQNLKSQIQGLTEKLNQMEADSEKKARKFDDAIALLQTVVPLLVPLIAYGPLKRRSTKKR